MKLKTDKPIIPPAEALQEFSRRGLTSKKCWLCCTALKAPTSPKYLCVVGAGNPKHWVTYGDAVKAIGKTAEQGQYNPATKTVPVSVQETVLGVGLVVRPELRLWCLDLDDAIADGQILPEAMEIIRRMDTYAERSASGNGIHIFFMMDGGKYRQINSLPFFQGKVKPALELFGSEAHFIMVTGNTLDGYTAIQERGPEFDSLYMDIIAPMLRTRDGGEKSAMIGKPKPQAKTDCRMDDTPEIRAIISHDWQTMRRLLKPVPRKYDTPGDFHRDLFAYPLHKFLGLDEREDHICLFHGEKHGSAKIFLTSEGRYIYHCFGCGKTWNILQLVEALGNYKFKSDAYDFLKKSLDMQIIQNKWYEKQRDELQGIIDMVMDQRDGFKIRCPAAYGNTWRGLSILVTLLMYIRDNCFACRFGQEDKIIFSVSKQQLAALVSQSGNPKSEKTVFQWLQVFKVSDILRPLRDDEIPPEILQKAIERTKRVGDRKHRHICFYEILPWAENHMTHLQERGVQYRELGYTQKSLCYEAVKAAEGEAVARKYYTQAATDGREVATVSRRISQKRKELADDVVYIALTILQEKGYFTEKDVLEEVRRQGKPVAEYEMAFKRHRSEILLNYNLIRKKANKEIRARFNIPEECRSYVWFEDEDALKRFEEE